MLAEFLQKLTKILSNYKKSNPINLNKLKMDLVEQFQLDIPIDALKEYLNEKGYTNIYLQDKKNIKQSNNNANYNDIKEDEDDFDPNIFLDDNEEKIKRTTFETSSYKDNIWMIKRFREEGKIEQLNELIQKNMGLVEKIVHRYIKGSGHRLDFDDLVQEGILGLMKAIERFDTEKGYQFSTYATWWIRQSVTRAIVDKGYTIRVPVHMYETIKKVLRVERESILKFNQIDVDWVVDQLDLDMEQYKEIKLVDHRFLHLASLDSVVSQEDESSSLIDFIETRPFIEVEELSADLLSPEVRILIDDRKYMLLDLMGSLKEREREVLLHRFGYMDGMPKTLEEIGQMYNVTRERIRQIESKALLKIREVIRKKKIDYEMLIIE